MNVIDYMGGNDRGLCNFSKHVLSILIWQPVPSIFNNYRVGKTAGSPSQYALYSIKHKIKESH